MIMFDMVQWLHYITLTFTEVAKLNKSELYISLVDKKDCKDILEKHHYLTGISKGFKSGINFGLFHNDRVIGICIFTGFPVPELVKGMFNLNRDDQNGFYELSRLCLLPEYQTKGGNIASYFMSKCLRIIKKDCKARAILSYADSDFHKGTIYQACNFKYYGLTDTKKDFWVLNVDGGYTKLSRGKTKGVAGEWRPRTRKHRYLMVFDKKLNLLWKQQDYPR